VSTGAISGAGALGNFPIWNSGADSPIWNTTQHADGWYDLTLTAASTATASLALLNTNALVHEGTLTANATWSSNKVQVVKHWVVVPSNRRLILGPGTIVKFTENTGIQVNDRGILTLKGVALTHIADDAVGGDTNMDGTQTQPPAGVGDAWLAWAFLPSMERVVFDAQGGSNEPDRFYTTGQTYGWLPKPTRAGYVFDGWRTAPHGGGTQVFENSAPSSGVHTLYATWSGITTTTPIPVPHVWLEDYGLVTDGDYEAAAFADTDGDGYPAWQEYIAGTDPTNRNSIFATIITISNDTPFLTWMPDMRPERLYTVEGKARLTDSLWISPTNAASRFFRVKVEMPK
jgi:uncharacterized repeat protein (TIGR02543 family)